MTKMLNPGENEEDYVNTINNLCSKLNVDAATVKKAKDSFIEINKNFTLEGDPLHWISCALYVACRTSVTPTVETGSVVEGNCVSLTRLLRLCNISLIQFFTKIKQWMDMALIPTDLNKRILRLERKFAVSNILIKNFKPLFQEIFTEFIDEPLKSHSKSKKPKWAVPCTSNALFEFTWCLYICVKGEFQNAADDLVDMYHIMLSCLDYVFANTFMARRIDLLNSDFKGLPNDWLSDDFKMPKEPPCIVSILCKIKDDQLAVEAATVKEYTWRPVIKMFFDKAILKGKSSDLTGILDIGIFDSNLKSLNNLYENYVLSVGEFDERIFLGEHANEQIGVKKESGDEISKVIASFGPSARTCPETPLTGRHYLTSQEPLTPVSEATNSLARLAQYLRQTMPHPSRHLLKLFADSGVSDEEIETNLILPCKRWMEQLASSLRESSSSEEIIKSRVCIVTCLYYKIFEHIIRDEHKKKPRLSLQALLHQEMYQLTVYACCTEIVLHANGVHSLKFPRVLDMFNLSAFFFYKIIELVVQAVSDKLSRDIIKHLNAVEEEVLESLVWTSHSPLWAIIERMAVPSYAEVSLEQSPFSRRSGLMSPVQSTERFVSPVGDQAKKQLFQDSIRPGQSLLATNNPEQSTSQSPQVANNGDTTPNSTPKKNNNSLVLFFRKFYLLATVRLKDLCQRLRLSDRELLWKIWTCLEQCFMHQTQLMKDRHLDQILMCTVYVVCRVSNSSSDQVERTFQDIMKCYRQRPLADNHVYRSVLIKPADCDEPAERGDLIKFYNVVFVPNMQSIAVKFAARNREELQLSPLPVGRGAAAAGAAQVRGGVCVKPLTASPLHPRHLTYKFSRSPAKDLAAINSMMMTENIVTKRALEAGDDGPTSKRARGILPGVARKLHSLMTDRQAL